MNKRLFTTLETFHQYKIVHSCLKLYFVEKRDKSTSNIDRTHATQISEIASPYPDELLGKRPSGVFWQVDRRDNPVSLLPLQVAIVLSQLSWEYDFFYVS